MLNDIISIRTQRFIKIWAKYFVVGLATVTAILAVFLLIVFGLVQFGRTYGDVAAFLLIFCGIVMIFVGGFTTSLTRNKLREIEREEKKVMDALKYDDNLKESLDSHKHYINYVNKHYMQPTYTPKGKTNV